MNGLFITSILCLFLYYVVSLTPSFGIAFILFGLTIVSMVAGIYKEFDKKNEKKLSHIKIVK
ncbi:hypothetical protein JMM81_14980 [Bacillus sp. V3B]|uniref:hypothetical protein n=1 Tax=Bacillus sp. V3B TaxID=2804915 RepID=UPI00210E0381|nr:hypothetical protein [Bacillus sp. V3B]MCQ6276230.1 hypothetical protein [Bacillus sp. V3B]